MCVRQSVLSSTHMTTLSIAIREMNIGFSCELNVCHKLVSIWWMREQTCLQTKECQVYQFESSTNISRQFENAHQTILRLVSNSSFLKSCDHPSEALRNFLQLLRLFIRQFTIPLCVNFLASRYFSVAVAEIRYSNFLPHSSAIVSFNLHLRWVRPKYTGSRNVNGSSRSTSSVHFFHIEAIFRILPAILTSSTCNVTNNLCFRWTTRHSQFGTFFQFKSQ